MIQVLAIVAGAIVIMIVWTNVLRSVFVPRQDPPRLPSVALRAVDGVFTLVSRVVPRRRRDRVLGLIAPISLFAMFGVWLLGLTLGFSLAAWGFAGLGPNPAQLAELLAFDTPGAILILPMVAWLSVTLLVGVFLLYLMRVTEAYYRRELLVTRLAAQAAGPPDAERILAAYVRAESRVGLSALFGEWHAWLSDIRYTHAGYPSLTYYRPSTELNWLEATVIVLDAAALVEAMAPSWALPNTRVLLDAGVRCLERLGSNLGIMPARSEISLHGREQFGFSDTIRLASAAGLPLERSPQDVWRVFQDMRTRYAPYAAAIGSALHYGVADIPAEMPLLLATR
jgi:hypothetical protein